MYKFILLSLCCFGIGLTTTVAADVEPPTSLDCDGGSDFLCAGPGLFEVEVRCEGPDEIFSGEVELYVDTQFGPPLPAFTTDFMYGSQYICFLGGILDMPKTEIKCTTAENSSGKKDQENTESSDITVEVQLIPVESPSADCPD